MSCEQVSRAVTFDDLVVTVYAWRFICDTCFRRQCFEDGNELGATQAGWKIYFVDDEERCRCPNCCAAAENGHSET